MNRINKITIFNRRSIYQTPDIHMYMLKDVPQVGLKGEIVMMRPDAARHYFVPQQLAYYIPKEQGKPVLPLNWSPKIKQSTLKEQILPADTFIPDSVYKECAQLLPHNLNDPQTTLQIDKILSEPQLKQLQSIGFLYFQRIPTKKGGEEIYGSVTQSDIQKLLETQYQIVVDRSMISVLPASKSSKTLNSVLPIKTIGTHSLCVLACSNVKKSSSFVEIVVVVTE